MLNDSMKRALQLAVVGCVGFAASGCFDKSVEQLMRSADTYSTKGDVNAAVIELKNAAQKEPSNGAVRLALGKLLMRQRDLLGAE